MAGLSLSSPKFSTPFLGQRLSSPKSLKNRAGRATFIRNPRCAAEGDAPTFPRTNVLDPYKRLGITPSASAEEIWGSRNFLLQQYAGHERSEESIEAAFERLLMTSFIERKKTKINLKTRLKKKVEESPPWFKSLLDFVEVPPKEVIFRRLFLFAFMGGWSIMNSAEGGPAFQVAVSLAACIFFLNEKTKNLGRAFAIGTWHRVDMWLHCGSIDPNLALAANMDTRTTDVTGRLRVLICRLYFPQMIRFPPNTMRLEYDFGQLLATKLIKSIS